MTVAARPTTRAQHVPSVKRLRHLLVSGLTTLALVAGARVSPTEATDASWIVENRSPTSGPAAFAASELERYLAATYDAATGAPAGQVILGRREDLPAELSERLPKPAPGFDGYAVAVGETEAGAPLWILGGDNDRGTLYGAYDLLERVGWRWFHPTLDPSDEEVRPEAENPTLDPGSWAVASPMRTRALIWFIGRIQIRSTPPSPAELRAEIDWAVKNRYNTLEYRALDMDASHPLRQTLREEAEKRGLRLQATGHNFGIFFPDSPEGFEEHPEWFGLKDGERHRHTNSGAQFCWTNEAATDLFLKNAVEFVAERPELDTLTVSAIDGGDALPCACATCSETPATDRYLALINRLVVALQTTAPDVTVEAIVGYQHVEQLPERVKPHPQLRGRFAAWGRGLGRGYSADRQGPKLATWSKAFDGRLTAFQYYSDHFVNPALAVPYITQMASDRDFLQKNADGMLNLLYLEDHWWRQTLNGSLAGRGFYDPGTDFEALLADYARRYHGPEAGPLMTEYYAALATKPRLGSRGLTLNGNSNAHFLTRLRKRTLDPATKRVGDDPVFRHRMEKARRWHEILEATVESAHLLRRARTRAEKGAAVTQRTYDAARAQYETAKEKSAAAAARRDGIIAREFAGNYERIFNGMVDRVHAEAEKADRTSEKNRHDTTHP